MTTVGEASHLNGVFVALLVACLMALSGCGQSFVTDRSLHLTAPAPLSTVQTPFTVSWAAAGQPGSRYAVFVDRLPVRPGHTMRDVALDQCKRRPSCYPDANFLSGLGIYLTGEKSLTIPNLKIPTGLTGTEHPPIHTLTVVRFSGQGTAGKRIGEAAWEVEFRGH